MSSSLIKLQALLAESKSIATVAPDRIVSSFYYDPTYNFAIFASVIRTIGREAKLDDGSAAMAINSAQLRFFSFCAVRPYVVASLKDWKTRSQQLSLVDLNDLRFLPHSFLLDTSLADALLFLLSSGNLLRHGAGGGSVALPLSENLLLNRLYRLVESDDLLKSERETIATIKDLKLSLTDLGFG